MALLTICYHGMTCLLFQFNIASIEKQAIYLPLKLDIIFNFYCMNLSLFVFILPDLIVLILPAHFFASSYLFLSFLTSEADLFVDQSVSPFPTGCLHICNILLLSSHSPSRFETIPARNSKVCKDNSGKLCIFN